MRGSFSSRRTRSLRIDLRWRWRSRSSAPDTWNRFSKAFGTGFLPETMPSHPSGPFTAFRIAENRFPLMDGGGAYRLGARWNNSGRHVIYAGLGFAVALIEKLARSRLGKVPKDHQFAEIFISAAVVVEEIGASDVPGWNDASYVASRAYGDAWYDSGRTAVLIVPSVP